MRIVVDQLHQLAPGHRKNVLVDVELPLQQRPHYMIRHPDAGSCDDGVPRLDPAQETRQGAFREYEIGIQQDDKASQLVPSNPRNCLSISQRQRYAVRYTSGRKEFVNRYVRYTNTFRQLV